MFLFSAENFWQAYKRVLYLKQYADYRVQQAEKIQEKTEVIKALNTKLLSQRKEKEQVLSNIQKEKSTLLSQKKEQEVLVASLRKEQTGFAAQIRRKEQAAAALDKQIEAIIRAAITASNKKSGATSTKKTEAFVLTAEAKALAKNFNTNKGRLPWPVEKGVLSRGYGTKRHPQLPNITTFCSGVEIRTETNQKARAVFEGEVFQIQQLKGANRAVYIRHGNFITVYNNLTKVLVKKGDKVSTKQDIGTVFTNPLTGKTILKFLLYEDSKRHNPAHWIYKM